MLLCETQQYEKKTKKLGKYHPKLGLMKKPGNMKNLWKKFFIYFSFIFVIKLNVIKFKLTQVNFYVPNCNVDD